MKKENKAFEFKPPWIKRGTFPGRDPAQGQRNLSGSSHA